MSYYDDWVEPNAFFKGGWRLGGKPVAGPKRSSRVPKTHSKDGCGVDVRLVDDPDEITCCACRALLEATE